MKCSCGGELREEYHGDQVYTKCLECGCSHPGTEEEWRRLTAYYMRALDDLEAAPTDAERERIYLTRIANATLDPLAFAAFNHARVVALSEAKA